MPTLRGAGSARLAVAPPQPPPAAAANAVPGVGSSGRSSAAHTPDLTGQCTSAANGGSARPGAEGVVAGSHRASPASSLASAASVVSSNASATSSSSRVVTASRRGRGMRPGDRAVAVRSPSPTGSGNVSAMASPITSASRLHLTPQVSPSHLSKVSTATAVAVAGGSASSRSGSNGTGTGTGKSNANASGVDGANVKVEQEVVSGDEDKKQKVEGGRGSPIPPDRSDRYPIIAIGGGGSASFTVSQSPKAAGPIPVDPHDQRTPKHNHLSARSNDRGPRQQTTDRPPSPIQGPSSAAAAAAAAAKALRTGQGMIMKAPPSSSSGGKKQPRSLEGRDNLSGNNPSSDSQAPLHKNHQPLSHQPHPFAYGGYQPHAIPHSPDDNAAASAAYYAAMYGHNPYGGYYNRDMTTNWPEEAEGSERSASADSDDRGTKKAAQAAYRHFDERDRAYLQYHRQHQQQAHHYYQHHSEHHRGFFHHPGNGSGYRPPPHVAREYIPSDEHVGGEAADTEDVISTRNNESNSSKSKSSGKVVMGSASPIHVARGMSTSPLAQNNMLAAGRHVTPHHHNHNTRQSSRKKIKEEEEEEPKPSLSASSIFRGRPGPSMSSRAADDFDDDDEDSPQRILLSLSKGDSFEDRGFGSAGSGGMVQMVGGDSTVGGAVKSGDIESSSPATLANGSGSNKKSATKGRGGKKKTKNAGKAVADSSKKSSANSKKSSKSSSKGGKKKATAKGSGKTPSSPDEPPRIQHSFSQNTRRGNDPFYFDPMRTPSGKVAMLDHQGPMIDNAPSFAPFFNTSFDSFGDPSKLAMSMSGGLGISPSFSFGLGVSNGQAINADDGGRCGPYPMPNNSLRLSFGPSHSFGDHQPIPAGADASKTMVLGEDPNAGIRNIADAAAIVLSGTSSGEGGAGSSVERIRSASTISSPSRRSTISSVKDFYDALQSHKLAFVECAFLLPGLKEALANTNELEKGELNDALPASATSSHSQDRTGGDSPDRGAGGCAAEHPPAKVISVGVTPARTQIVKGNNSTRRNVSEVAIARRRVKSAICAFGGSGYTIPSTTTQEDTKTSNGVDSNNASIFRTKKKEENPPVDSPGTKTSSAPKSGDREEEGPKSETRKTYDAKLLARFYENNNRLTWEVEEDPPISSSVTQYGSTKRKHPNLPDRDGKKPRLQSNPPATPTAAKGNSTLSQASGGAPSIGSPQGKMKYRCKLCGQPKQNHVCPYKKSLQRSIGTMVHSAVNAYTADEPGRLAPSLSSMNNFVSKPELSSVASTPSRGGPKPQRTLHPESVERKLAHITPQSIRVGTNSPGGSSLSTLESPPRGRNLPPRSAGGSSRRGGARTSGMRFPSIASSGSSLSGGGNFLFVEASELRPGQFRAVAPLPKTEDAPYQYASLPLPYGQRKRLSDKLFGMSKEVPNLTDECAHVLREAREKDMWDRAIAELLTQILVVLDCSPDDRKLDGIRRHLLLHYGVAC